MKRRHRRKHRHNPVGVLAGRAAVRAIGPTVGRNWPAVGRLAAVGLLAAVAYGLSRLNQQQGWADPGYQNTEANQVQDGTQYASHGGNTYKQAQSGSFLIGGGPSPDSAAGTIGQGRNQSMFGRILG